MWLDVQIRRAVLIDDILGIYTGRSIIVMDNTLVPLVITGALPILVI